MQDVYWENVAYGLEYAQDLLEALDGKTVVTADHGELLGESVPLLIRLLHARWGIRDRHYYDWDHYAGVHEPELVEVPWVEIEGGTRYEITAADEPAGTEMDELAIELQPGVQVTFR